MRVGEETKSIKQERCAGVKARTARGRKRKRQGRRTLSVKVKIRFASPIGFITPRVVLSGAHAPRALTAGKNFSR
jgi:hypothetical protein